MIHPSPDVQNSALPINDAGLGLLQSYLPVLFSRAGLTNDKGFISPAQQQKAVRYCDFLVTGQQHLGIPGQRCCSLLLCGVTTPMELEMNAASGKYSFSTDEFQLLESLLHTVIAHWPEAGSSSIDGFRGNWLLRKGVLLQLEQSWELTVERRPYDLLLTKCPFSFTYTTYSWMPLPLQVYWKI
jgi:hypothetical protein